MVCLSFSSSSCQDAHPTALDYVLAVLVMVTAVVAARLLASAVARCLCGDGDGPDAHHHHHHHHDHHHHSPDDATTDVDEDVVEELPWGAGAGLAIFGQPGMDVPPAPPRRNDQGWHWHSMLAPPGRRRSAWDTSLTPAHRVPAAKAVTLCSSSSNCRRRNG